MRAPYTTRESLTHAVDPGMNAYVPPTLLAAAAFALTFGCSQLAEDTCQKDSDCAGDQICRLDLTPPACVRGPGASTDGGTPGADGGPEDDAGSPPPDGGRPTGCAQDSDCIDPGPCETAAGATCADNTCAYPVVTSSRACALAGEEPPFVTGRCADDGRCVACIEADDCPPFVDGPALCASAQCVQGTCRYEVDDPDLECAPAGCRDGILRAARQCGTEGTCPPADNETSCGGFACASDTQCGVACTTDAECIEDHFCATGVCLPRRPDGQACRAANECLSSYCDNGTCCGGGECCVTPADCSDDFSAEPQCENLGADTDCQGVRRDATCIDNQCGTETIDDDRACDGAAFACPENLSPIVCTNAFDQPVPQCPADCTTDGCVASFICAGGVCEREVGIGQPCGPGIGECGPNTRCGAVAALCCADPGPRCCDSNDDCVGGLRCNVDSFSCIESCVRNADTDCADPNEYCVDGTECGPKIAQGLSCSNSGQCQTGNCVDGVCCASAACGTCQRCMATTGQCAAVTNGSDPGTCDATGLGCSGNRCSCTAGGCRTQTGGQCVNGAQCVSGNCQCASPTCTTRVCSNVSCADCRYTTDGLTCSGIRRDGTDCGAGGQCVNGQCSLPGTCSCGRCERDPMFPGVCSVVDAFNRCGVGRVPSSCGPVCLRQQPMCGARPRCTCVLR